MNHCPNHTTYEGGVCADCRAALKAFRIAMGADPAPQPSPTKQPAPTPVKDLPAPDPLKVAATTYAARNKSQAESSKEAHRNSVSKRQTKSLELLRFLASDPDRWHSLYALSEALVGGKENYISGPLGWLCGRTADENGTLMFHYRINQAGLNYLEATSLSDEGEQTT